MHACLLLHRLDLGGVGSARARRGGRPLTGHELVECAVPDRTRIQLAVERVVHQPEHGDAALVCGAETGRRTRQHHGGRVPASNLPRRASPRSR